MNNEKRLTIFAHLKQYNPEPKTELVFHNHFQLLIAVMLSAQATDVSVNKATKPLFEIIFTPKDMLALGEAKLKAYIKSIGLYNTKAKNVIKTAAILQENHNGTIPASLTLLESLPGVGRKTANVVLNEGFGIPTIAVDTHVFRVANRTGLAKGNTPLLVEKKLLRTTPKAYLLGAHHWLILHGRYVCKARKPLCHSCCIATWCEFKGKLIDEAPTGNGKR